MPCRFVPLEITHAFHVKHARRARLESTDGAQHTACQAGCFSAWGGPRGRGVPRCRTTPVCPRDALGSALPVPPRRRCNGFPRGPDWRRVSRQSNSARVLTPAGAMRRWRADVPTVGLMPCTERRSEGYVNSSGDRQRARVRHGPRVAFRITARTGGQPESLFEACRAVLESC